MRILLVSGSGFLGGRLARHFAGRCVATTRDTLDLSRPAEPQVARLLSGEPFSHAIVCAAVSDVEACYRDPKGSRRVNVEAAGELASFFRARGIRAAFLSTDLVFDCESDFRREDEPVNPTTEYGRQKVAAEKHFIDGLVFRTSKLMGFELHPRNILTPLVAIAREGRSYRAFRDQFITPLFAEDACRAIELAFRAGATGTYHLAGDRRLSRVDLAREVCRRLGVSPDVIEECSVREAPVSEPRGPLHTLNGEKIRRELGFLPTSLEDGLKKLLP